MHTLSYIANAQKSLLAAPSWSTPDENSYVRFLVNLVIDGFVEEGVTLSGGCFLDMPEQHVTFELRCSSATTPRAIPLVRIDWRSLQGGHTNTRKHKRNWPDLPSRTSNTHIHEFETNYSVTEDRMKGKNLPLAQNITNGINSFDDLLVEVGRSFKVSNINLVPKPQWDYNLFNYDDYR